MRASHGSGLFASMLEILDGTSGRGASSLDLVPRCQGADAKLKPFAT